VSALAILSELQRRGVSVTADGDALVLKPRRAIDSELLARVREHKPEIIRALSARPTTCAASCSSEWPAESLETEQRFGLCHARLFLFVERRVWTPAGTGKLYKTGADYSEIVLDGSVRNADGSENRIRVRTEDVRPIQ
jgi:hypothetical protein